MPIVTAPCSQKKLPDLAMLHRSGERRQEKTGGVWQLSEKMRLPGTCCTVCPSNVMKYDMKSWFATMWNVLEKEGLLKQTSPVAHYSPQISNPDETGFCLWSTKKILARRGAHNVHEVSSASHHEFITISA